MLTPTEAAVFTPALFDVGKVYSLILFQRDAVKEPIIMSCAQTRNQYSCTPQAVKAFT